LVHYFVGNSANRVTHRQTERTIAISQWIWIWISQYMNMYMDNVPAFDALIRKLFMLCGKVVCNSSYSLVCRLFASDV